MKFRLVDHNRIAAGLAGTLLMSACGAVPNVEGWPLDREIACDIQSSTADANVVLNTEIRRRLGDAAVIDHRCWYPGPYSVDGHQVMWATVAGGIELHVFTIADGTRYVIALSCPGTATLQPGQNPVPGLKCLIVQRP
jgi:hypothetical protein